MIRFLHPICIFFWTTDPISRLNHLMREFWKTDYRNPSMACIIRSHGPPLPRGRTEHKMDCSLCRVPGVMHAIDRSGSWPSLPRKPSLRSSCQMSFGRLLFRAMRQIRGVQYCEHHIVNRVRCETACFPVVIGLCWLALRRSSRVHGLLQSDFAILGGGGRRHFQAS